MIKIIPESLEESGPFSDALAKSFVDEFAGGLSREFLEFVCGQRLGHGCSREVYDCRIRSNAVIKIETAPGYFANVQEAATWELVKDHPDHARWFAPVLGISSCGRILLQSKTKRPALSDLPDLLPTYFTDTKVENFGMLKGRLVCHDYAATRLASRGLINRQSKVFWI